MATVDSASARLAAQLRRALSVQNHVDISASRNVVFGAVSEPRHLETFHPFCRSNPIIRWNAESRRDVIEYRNGRVFVREFLEWSDLEGFELLIGPTGWQRSLVLWTFEERGESSCRVSIQIHPHVFQPRPQFVFFLLGRRWVRKSLETYLRSVLLGLKHYCETGENVAPNQWGVHPYFSAA